MASKNDEKVNKKEKNDEIDIAWDAIENVIVSLQAISSTLGITLEGKERSNEDYRAIQGMMQLADFQERKLSSLVYQTH
ncbi:hypothetical protein [Vibrio splendidus]|uniref:hypothetical protein n=1 Tax=Vibrio splendidus TaxID=29497 RepID=UPI000D3831AC|nr:hypothetical protein [Vibrio splendidus]PTO77554.1 hypothetical protein CWN84_10165 [Vibrio splendidus]